MPGQLATTATALAAVVALTLPTPASAGVRHRLPAPAAGLAADGSRTAVLVGDPSRGDGRVRVVWNLRTGRSVDVRIGGPVTFAPPHERLPSTGATRAGVALAGRRVLWRERFRGNTTEERLRAATTVDPVPRRVGSLARHENDRGTGTYIAGLAGDAATLVAGTVRLGLVDPGRCSGLPADPPGACDLAARGGLLRLVLPAGYRALVRGPQTPQPQAVDDGRIAGLRADGHAVLLPTAGAAPVVLDAGGDRPIAVALDGRDLVVLTASGSLRTFDGRGAAGRSFDLRHVVTQAVAAGPPRLDVHDGLVVLTVGRVTYGLRLDDGRLRVLVRFPTVPVGVGIEEAGLSYAWNSGGQERHGHLGWMPLAEVRSRLADPRV